MSKHRLFCDTSQNSHFNLSAESTEVETASSLRPETERGGETVMSANKNNEENVEVGPSQNIPDSGKEAVSADNNYGGKVELFSSQSSPKSDDSMDEKPYFSEFFEKRMYTYEEDVEILNFVLKDQNIFRVSSILLWKYLEVKKTNPRRTYQSLKNRFLRNIKPHLFTTYRHLIKNEEQIKKILSKFPELKKEIKTREPLLIKNLRRESDEIIESTFPNQNLNKNPRSLKVSLPKLSATVPPQGEKFDVKVESEKRNVEFSKDSILVTFTVPRNMGSSDSNNKAGIYQKYLNCKAKNKLIPCSACGRCGGPEEEVVNALQNNDNDSSSYIRKLRSHHRRNTSKYSTNIK